MVYSQAYGLRLRSTVLIPGLAATEPTALFDVDIRIGESLDDRLRRGAFAPRHFSSVLDREGHPVCVVHLCEKTGAYFWEYPAGPRFVVEPDGRNIGMEWSADSSMDEATLCLLGPILGFVLRLRGITCLHASAVAVDGKVFALVGRPAAGKSTTAAALLGFGCSLVSEDVVPLVDRGAYFDVQPGYPLIRLWPKSVNMLFGFETALPLLSDKRDKRRLDVEPFGYRFEPQPLPLAAVYYLDRRSRDESAPRVGPLPSHRAMVSLVGDSYTNYVLSKDMRAREFAVLGQLVQRVPLRLVTPHGDPARLPDLCRAILDDFARLNEPSGRPAERAAPALGRA